MGPTWAPKRAQIGPKLVPGKAPKPHQKSSQKISILGAHPTGVHRVGEVNPVIWGPHSSRGYTNRKVERESQRYGRYGRKGKSEVW